MKIELKKISYSQQLSQETNAFSADVYIDGVKCANASNHGHGGSTNILALKPEFRSKIEQAEAYCKTLPPEVHSWGTVNIDLEYFIDKLMDKHLNDKENKRFEQKKQKAMVNKIVLSNEDGNEYATFALHRPERTIASYMATEFEKKHLIRLITDIYIQSSNKKYGTFKVANTNIPADMIAEAMAAVKI